MKSWRVGIPQHPNTVLRHQATVSLQAHSRQAGARRAFLVTLYALATVQIVWCYLWLVRPYVQTVKYEHGEERMPFQGRFLMAFPMRWAHHNPVLLQFGSFLSRFIYWFPKMVQPEVLVQGVINVVCIAIAGIVATKIYNAASKRHLLTPLVYPLVLVLCIGTYVLHTIQNFRFIYDLPSLAFFSLAFYILYFGKHTLWFVLLFLVATINRETTLLLLGLFMLTRAEKNGRVEWRRLFAPQVLSVVLPLSAYWIAVQVIVRHVFVMNRSEFYPRIPLNLTFFVLPNAWPQLLGGCCYLLPIVLIYRKNLQDAVLRSWLWILPAWFAFMFVYGILIETRIFGELIPFIATIGVLMAEEAIVARLSSAGKVERLPVLESRSEAPATGFAGETAA